MRSVPPPDKVSRFLVLTIVMFGASLSARGNDTLAEAFLVLGVVFAVFTGRALRRRYQ